MKLIAFLAFVSLATAGWAQAPAKPEAQKPAPEAAKPAAEPVKPLAEAPKQPATGPKIPNPRRWTEDARHCLELPSSSEVIKCAEEYL